MPQPSSFFGWSNKKLGSAQPKLWSAQSNRYLVVPTLTKGWKCLQNFYECKLHLTLKFFGELWFKASLFKNNFWGIKITIWIQLFISILGGYTLSSLNHHTWWLNCKVWHWHREVHPTLYFHSYLTDTYNGKNISNNKYGSWTETKTFFARSQFPVNITHNPIFLVIYLANRSAANTWSNKVLRRFVSHSRLHMPDNSFVWSFLDQQVEYKCVCVFISNRQTRTVRGMEASFIELMDFAMRL